ncbi:hypothetical protein CDD83_6596 [Cordyceps sp. RAO-2017]|nr:hypothetical protein CDD83_6596 [Cordyceps sp. RAO-2017]
MVDYTPISLDEAIQVLYRRAIADPSSLSDEERRKITHRPPVEEEDSLCREACGLSMGELITKAIQNEDSLSYEEARLVISGVFPNQSARLLHRRVRLSEADRDLTFQAEKAATTEDIYTARKNAKAVRDRWYQAHITASDTLDDDDSENVQHAMSVPWQNHVLSLTDTSVCGLVVFFPDKPEWPAFKEQIETGVRHGLNYCHSLIKEEVIAAFTLHWVEDHDAGALQSRFAIMRSGNQFPAGLRLDSFLYIDDQALRSCDEQRPFVWLWEPQSSAKPLKVHIKHIAPTLFARLTQRDLPVEEKRRRPYRHTSELERLHNAADYSRDADGKPDGIWPAPTRYM